MQRVMTPVIALLGLVLASPVWAQTGVSDPGRVALQDFSGGASLNGTYFDVRNQTGNGVGYKNGYTQLGAFMPFYNSGDVLFAGQVRGIITDNSGTGVNVGGVARYYNEGQDRIYGVNAYYDNDQQQSKFRYSQIAFGFESLGRFLDYRANGYIPTSRQQNVIGPTSLGNTPFYYGNNIAFQGFQLAEQALAGADWEVGVPLIPGQRWLRGYAGMYIYEKRGNNAPVGVRGRIEGWVSDDLSLGVQTTSDAQFGTNVNAIVNFQFAGFKPTRYFPHYTTRERMLMPVQRNWRVAVSQFEQIVPVNIINPADAQPYFVTWVDSANPLAGPGTGTFENPFKTLPGTAPTSDLVLVRQGLSTAAAPYIGSITLPNDARLLGEGIAHQFAGTATFGSFMQNYNGPLPSLTLPSTAIPPVNQNDPALYPWLSNPAGSVVNLANNNEVRGFNILNSSGSAITSLAPVNNTLLRDLNLTGNAAGINLNGLTGIATVQRVDASNNSGFGIFMSSGANPLTVAMTNITANNNGTAGLGAGVALLASGSSLGGTISNLTASGNQGTGLALASTNGQSINFGGTSLTNINTSGNVGSGVTVATDTAGSTAAAQFNGLVSVANGVNGLTLTAADTSTQTITVINSLLVGNTQDAINVTQTGGALVNLFVDPTDGSGAGRDGFHFDVSGGSILNATLENTTFNFAGRDGIFGDVRDANSQATVVAAGTTASSAGRSGLNLSSTVGGQINFNMANGDLQNAGQNPAFLTNRNAARLNSDSANSILNVNLSDTSGEGAADQGLFFNASNTGTLTANVINGSFNGTGIVGGAGAIDGTLTTGGVANLNLTNVTTNNSRSSGFTLAATGPARPVFTGVFNNAQFNNAARHGLEIAADDADVNLTMANGSTANNAVLDGLNVNAINGSTVFADVSNGSFSNNGQRGVFANVAGAGTTATVNLTNTVVNSNATGGLRAIATAGGQFDGTATASSFSSNLGGLANGQGIDLAATGINSQANMELFGSTVLNNTGAGVRATANADGTVGVTTGVNGTTRTTIAGNAAQGINMQLTAAGAAGNLLVDSTDITGNAGDGILAQGTAGTLLNQLLVTNSTVTNNAGIGLNVPMNGGTVGTVFVDGNTITGNFGGVLMTGIAGTATPITISNNTLSNNRTPVGSVVDEVRVQFTGGTNGLNINSNTITNTSTSATKRGIVVDVLSPAIVNNMNINFNSITSTPRAGSDGIQVNVANGARLQGVTTLDSNTVTRAGGNGIHFALANNSQADQLNLAGNQVNTSGLNGILIEAPQPVAAGPAPRIGAINITDGGVSSGNVQAGISLQLTGVTGISGGATNITVSDQTIANNGTFGVDLNATNSTLGAVLLQNVGVSNSGGPNGVRTNFTGGSVQSVTLDNVTTQNTTTPVLAGNGIEVTATNGFVGAVTVTNGGASNSNGNGINVALSNVTGVPDVTISNTTNANNTAQGISVTSDSDLGAFLIQNNTVASSGTQGIFTSLSNLNVESFDVNTNTVSTSGGTGIDLSLNTVTGMLVNGVQVTQNTISGSGGSGLSLAMTNTPVPVINVSQNSSLTSTNDGIVLNLDGSGATTSMTVNTNTVNGAGGNGINFNATNGSVFPTVAVSNNTIGGTAANTLDGIRFSLNNASNVTSAAFANNTIASSGQNGVELLVTNSDLTTNTLTENQISGSGVDGIRMLLPTTNSAGAAGNLTMNLNRNTITGLASSGTGVNLSLAQTGRTLNATFDNNTITGHGNNGVNLLTSNNVVSNLTFNSGTTVNPTSGLTGNNISNNGAGADTAQGFGVHVVGTNSSVNNVTFGGTGTGRNILTGNRNAGVGIELSNTTTGTVNISNVDISGTRTGTATNYAGDGIRVSLADRAILGNAATPAVSGLTVGGSSATSNTSLRNNAGRGFSLDVSGQTQAFATTIQNSVITGNGTAAAAGNRDGVQIVRNNEAKLVGTALTNNNISSNLGNGVNISLIGGNQDVFLGGNLTLDFTATGNTISSNTVNGINMLGSAQSLSSLTVGGSVANPSTISNNGQSGINLTTDFSAGLTAAVRNTTLNANGQDGITMALNRTSAMTLTALDTNVITNSVRDGVRVTTNGGSTFVGSSGGTNGIIGNTITGSGGNGINLTVNDGSNMVIGAIGTTTSGNVISSNGLNGIVATINDSGSDATLTIAGATNNTIAGNGVAGDITNNNGVALRNLDSGANPFNSRTLTATFTDNQVRNNAGRGFELINRGNGDMTVTLASASAGPPTGPNPPSLIAQNGRNGVYVENNANALNTSNVFTLRILDQAITGNGITTGATPNGDDDRNGVWIRQGTSTFGSLTADVQRNYVSGNTNIDFAVNTFTSDNTQAALSQQRWDSVNFQADPLAQISLNMAGNTGNRIDVTRSADANGRTAVYNNSDQYKSQAWIFGAGQTTRNRNATRLENNYENVLGAGAVASSTTAAQVGPLGGAVPGGIRTFTATGSQLVDGTPAPTASVISSNEIDNAIGFQGRSLVGSAINLGGQREITVSSANGTDSTITFVPGLGAAPGVGTAFTVDALRIAGVGRSTMRSTIGSVNAAGNSWATVLSNFGTQSAMTNTVFGNDPYPFTGSAPNGVTQTFTWSVDATFPSTYGP